MTDDILALEDFLPYRLNRLADAISRDFSATYREQLGITRPEWRLLATLGQYGTMTATEIGRHSAMHKTKVSRAVTALEQRRWVVRETDQRDRRAEHLKLTAAGEQTYRTMVPVAKAYQRRLEKAMSIARFAEFHHGLERLEAAVLNDSSDL
jgi:DNA-binding MarR family transcriptional regulator